MIKLVDKIISKSPFTVLKGLTVVCLLQVCACADYLDVVPDNIATLENAFVSAPMAEKYLFTCYSYMPDGAEISNSQSFLINDEFWGQYPRGSYFSSNAFLIVGRGMQNVVDPGMNYWDGAGGCKSMFVGIRTCNIFIENIETVPEESFNILWSDINGTFTEKDWWTAEAIVLKAYYHYILLRMYGPIPLIRENLPVSASVDEVQIPREPVDECFKYIIELLDEAIPRLPETTLRPATDLGRINRVIALALKAKVLLEAASPLFNGNTDYAAFINPEDNQPFFNQTYDESKWTKAAEACKSAIDAAHDAGHSLYVFTPMPTDRMNDTLTVQMSIRNAVAEGNINLNREGIWLQMNQNIKYLQERSMVCIDAVFASTFAPLIAINPPLKIAEMFYSDHGVPIEDDAEWASSGKYANRYQIRTITDNERYIMRTGEQTASLNFDREPRFYANLAFDRSLWFGNGRFDKDNQWFVKLRSGDPMGAGCEPITGYGGRKLINYQTTLRETAGSEITAVNYGWPLIRLADLYLMYAEALNEAGGPTPEVFEYLDLIRARAGLEPVADAWSNYALPAVKTKYTTRDGLRDIIHRERLIEMYAESHRYWDIRRWKRAQEMWHNQPVQGWNYRARDAETYYMVNTLFTLSFTFKDYLFPIRESNLNTNLRLVQNPGWE
jgi:hypothetical protein